MTKLSTILAALAMLLLCGCPPPAKTNSSGNNGDSKGTAQTSPKSNAANPLKITLLASDLGIGDGWTVREINDILESKQAAGQVELKLAGELPRVIKHGEITADVGLPDATSEIPGTMTDLQAAALLDSAAPSDILILSSGYVLKAALERIASGKLQTDAVIVVDETGGSDVDNTTNVPVYRLRFDICHAAFMAGASAARSSNVAHFMLLGAQDDPQVDEFMAAAEAGMEYVSPSAWIKQAILPVDSRGIVTPETFRETHVTLLNEAGQNFKCNHYVLDLTRSTPYVIDLISDITGPINGYASSGYEDLRNIDESRILTCAIKRSDVAMSWLLDNISTVDELQGLAVDGYIDFGLAGSRPGLEESAIGWTNLELYSRENFDGEDIEADLQIIWSEIEAGELGIDYCLDDDTED